MKRTFLGTKFSCDVFEDESGQRYLVALCGGIAWTRVGIVMNEAEDAEFRQRPAFAEELARKLCYDFDPYRDRAIPEHLQNAILAAEEP
jgi:hypothetical protein